MVLAHEFYCLGDFCDKEVDSSETYCPSCIAYEKKLYARIKFIEEKLKTNMTPAQTADWKRLLNKAMTTYIETF